MCLYIWGGAKPLLSCVTYILIQLICIYSWTYLYTAPNLGWTGCFFFSFGLLHICACNICMYTRVQAISIYMCMSNSYVYACICKPHIQQTLLAFVWNVYLYIHVHAVPVIMCIWYMYLDTCARKPNRHVWVMWVYIYVCVMWVCTCVWVMWVYICVCNVSLYMCVSNVSLYMCV